MHKVTFVLACLSYAGAGAGAGRRTRTSSQRLPSSPISERSRRLSANALARMFVACSPAAGFTSSCQGLQNLGGPHALAAANSAVLMSDAGAPDIIRPGISKLTRRKFAASAALLPLASKAKVLTAAPPFAKQPGFALNTGTNFPTASFGLQVYGDDEAEKLTTIALEAGFRNFFASVLARNQRGFARAIKKSGIPREELFICGSVLSNRANGFQAAYGLSAQGCKENMEAFSVGGIDYIDMIMLDYPGPDAASIQGQWKALEEMKAAGLTRSLAVSNFDGAQLDAILNMKGATAPTVNQLPYGVGFNNYYDGKAAEVIEENRKRGVLVQAWSPLGRCLRGSRKDALAEVGKKYGKSAAQVALRWIADTGVTFTTQTKNPAHFQEDINIFDFKLTKEEISMLAAL